MEEEEDVVVVAIVAVVVVVVVVVSRARWPGLGGYAWGVLLGLGGCGCQAMKQRCKKKGRAGRLWGAEDCKWSVEGRWSWSWSWRLKGRGQKTDWRPNDPQARAPQDWMQRAAAAAAAAAALDHSRERANGRNGALGPASANWARIKP